MWRTESVHKRDETEYLDDAITRLQADLSLHNRADALLHAARVEEPLIDDLLKTPQSPHYHAEGPVVEDHLRLILICLYGVVNEQLHLIDIEEFRRLKGYEGEIEEIEELLKEHVALFEVFALCHDLGKYGSFFVEAEEGGKGAALGLQMEASSAWHPIGLSDQAKIRARYTELFQTYAKDRSNDSREELARGFYEAYGLRVRYPGHARLIHSPPNQRVLHRFAAAHRLTDQHTRLLELLIAYHLESGMDFREPNPKRMKRYYRLAETQGFDGDDLIDFLQACLFLDFVCGSKRMSRHGSWHEATSLINFLQSEHDYAPHKKGEKEALRESARQKERNRHFRKAGLDGVALMDLFGMESGPQFGKVLERIHAAVLGKAEMPKLPSAEVEKELRKRIDRYYEAAFDKEASEE